ncbi:MAG: tautomerase family protein [Rhodococcus sp. (in: high G+C Gram-positive bacteria)]
MPSSLIEVRCTHDRATETAIIDAVHEALVTAFAIPETDKHIRLLVHDPARFAVPPTLAFPQLYTLVTIDCYAGRSVDAKRRLYTEIVRRLGELGIPADHVTIVVRGHTTDNWGIRGGQAACDVDLCFTVEV